MPPLVRIKHWPARPERARFVAVYRQGGKRQVRYFKAEKLAKTFAMQKEVELLNEGRRHAEISESEKRAVYAAREAGVDLINALDAFIAQQGVLARSLPLARAADEFLEVRENEGKSVGHLKDLKIRLRSFIAAVDDDESLACASISTRDVDSWLSSLRVAPQTRLNCRRALHNFFSYCVSRGYASKNVVASASKVKVPPKAPEILSVTQTRALLNSCAREILPAVAIAAFAGLRHAEISRLSWNDVDLARKFIEVKAKNSKTATRRLVTISTNLRAWLSLKESNADGFVYPARVYRARFKEACKAAGFDRWPHNALRHSFASYHLALHRDASRTALELGHTESRTLFAHYRELVTREDAKDYWKIFPTD